MITEKDNLFQWLVPTSSATGKRITEDMRVNAKHYQLYVSRSFISKYFKGTDLSDFRVAFVNMENNESPFAVFNPIKGVPFYKFSLNRGHDSSPSIGNKALCDAFVKKFNLHEKSVTAFALTPFQSFNGMMFFAIEVKKQS